VWSPVYNERENFMVRTMDILDYEYYTEDFGGYLITDEAVFGGLARKAWAFVNHITFGAITSLDADEVSDDIKNAVCAVAEDLAVGVSHGGMVSEHNDGYAVTYAPHSDVWAAVYATAAMYLPAQMLYKGIG